MKADTESINRIMNEYEEIRIANEESWRKRIAEVYEKIPEIKEIDTQIRMAGTKMMQGTFENPKRAAEFKDEMHEKFAVLKNKKQQLLRQHNIPADYMDRKYVCSFCKDTGYTENKKCKCFEQKLINQAYTNSNLSARIKNQNFGTFSFEYYSSIPIKAENNTSPLERIKNIYRIAREFSADIDNFEKSLMFYGKNGLGKTFLSSCIAKEVLDSGKTVIYTTATRIFSLYEDNKFNRRNTEEIINKAFECDLLIIDDLGAEYVSRATVPFLFELLNSRLLERKKFIISTNLGFDELTTLYSNRFTSRIYEYFIPLKFLGEDIRVKKLGI